MAVNNSESVLKSVDKTKGLMHIDHMTVTSYQFDIELDGLRSAIASVKACRTNEIANEARILTDVFNRCKKLQLIRSSAMREARRENLFIEATNTMINARLRTM